MLRNSAIISMPTFKIILGLGLCTVGGAMLFSYFKQQQRDDDDAAAAADKVADPGNDGKRSSNKPKAALKKPQPVTVQFDVANEHIPLIVGRSGNNLNLIEEKTQTKIRFRDKDDKYKICEIVGLNDNVKEARALLNKEIERAPLVKEEIFVPQSVCGKITGRCGESLQEICRVSLAKVSVDATAGRSGGGMDQRRLVITGTRQQVNIARKMIQDKIEEDEEVRRAVEDVEKHREPRRSPTNSVNSSLYSSQTSLNSQLPPREKLLAAKTDEKPMEVYVSALASPSKFWVQIIGPQSKKLDNLVDEMTEYYNDVNNQSLHRIAEPYLGQIVAALFRYDSKWYRAEIVAIVPHKFKPNEIAYDLYFVDYGDSEYVDTHEVFDLRTDFLTLRFQAVECFLANVKSTRLKTPNTWDESSIEKFEDLTQVANWKKLIARVITYKERPKAKNGNTEREGSPIPGVELYDLNEGVEINLGHMLISHGFALPTEDQQSHCSLSPRSTNQSIDLSYNSAASGVSTPVSQVSPNVTTTSYEDFDENSAENTLIEQQVEKLNSSSGSDIGGGAADIKLFLNAENTKKLTADFINGNASGEAGNQQQQQNVKSTPATSSLLNGHHKEPTAGHFNGNLF